MSEIDPNAALAGNGPKGNPDPNALSEIEKANSVPSDWDDVGAEEPDSSEADSASESSHTEARRQMIREILQDPAMRQEFRNMLGVQQSEAPPAQGRNYRGEEALRVHGGVEVEHPPEFKDRPLPPGYIMPYLTEEGRKTYYLDRKTEPRKRHVPLLDDNGKPTVNEEGVQIMTEETVEVEVDPGAGRDANGEPLLTKEYQAWLKARSEGRKLSSQVQTRMAQDEFVADDVGVEIA